MDKINYNQHDWNKGEVIKEENLDNMENGIKQATDKINEIIDTEQDFKDRMADIDGRIDINNEELVIARDGCDNLGQRIERDQQYIYNILNDGSYLEFNGTDIDINNAKDGYTKDTILKGQTYQNLIINANEIKNKTYIGNSTQQMYGYKVLRKANTVYTIIAYVSKNTLDNSFSLISWGRTEDGTSEVIPSGITGLIKKSFTTNDNVDEDYFVEVWKENTTGEITIDYMIILEGDWTNKEVPSEITGIESVGDKENNKISILSHNKNLFTGEGIDINSYGLKYEYKDGIVCVNGTSTTAYVNSKARKVEWLEIGKFYTFSTSTTSATDSGALYGVFRYNKNNKTQYIIKNTTIEWTGDCSNPYIYIQCEKQGATYNNATVKVQLEEGSQATSCEPYKEDKKEILLSLDGGLKSLPDGTCDTIEQREDGIYLVQRVGKYTWTGAESFSLDDASDNSGDYVTYHNSGLLITRFYICNKFIRKDFRDFYSDDSKNMECTSDGGGYPRFYIRMLKSKLNENTVSGFKQWLQANPVTVYYELNAPIETKLDIDTLNLETFKDKTYILSKNNIKPEIVCKAPVDVNQTIADLQGEQEQLIETYNTLKEENEAVKTAISELNEQEDVQTADMLDLDMRVLALEEGLE